jgi:hypothetical protein
MKKIKEKRYVARIGANFNNDKAKEIGEYLESRKIDLKNYVAIYEDALKNEGSPIYAQLEWSNETAADSFRLQQIKNIVEHISLEVVYEDETITVLPRAFELVTKYEDQPRELVGILEGLTDEESRNQIIERAFTSLLNWWKTYQAYKEFQPVGDVIGKIGEELQEKGYVSL